MRVPLSQTVADIFKRTLAGQTRVTPDGERLLTLIDEPTGWEQFLTSCGPRTFTSSFAGFHREFWDWYWHLMQMRRAKRTILDETLSFVAAWPRGGGKSSNIEWACIVEGAMGLPGYVLYVSRTQSSANSHVADIRRRLESDEIARYFPDLAEPEIGRHGGQYGWRQDFLMTKGGWAIRPVGLDVAVRGLREGDLRPTMIVFDDIDDYNMSVAEVQTNLETISRSILPAGTKHTIQLVAQNLISEHSAVNQIVQNKTDVLSDHVPSIHPAFRDLEINKIIDQESGKQTYSIASARPTWEEMDMEAAHIYLNKVGLEAFMAEYQHDFSLDSTEKVIPEYDDYTHVITWSQFNERFGTSGTIPKHWQAGLGLDIGYTEQHLAAWSWIAVSAEDSPLPWAYFRYRGMTFTAEGISDQAEKVLAEIVRTDPEEPGGEWDERNQYTVSKMSHEKAGERMELNRRFEFSFSECKFRKEDGIPQWRGLLRVDHTLPHPFHADELDPETKRYRIGRPNFFDVVADEEFIIPRTDRGLAVHRAQTLNWKRRKVTLLQSGLTDAIPMKYEDDANDSTRMILAENSLSATPLTRRQVKLKQLRERVGEEGLELEKGRADYQGVLMRRQMELNELKRRESAEIEHITEIVRNVLIQAPPKRRNNW